jgi:hypothetical protein
VWSPPQGHPSASGPDFVCSEQKLEKIAEKLTTLACFRTRVARFQRVLDFDTPKHPQEAQDNEELITHVARRPGGALGVVQVQSSARPRSRSMLVEVSGPCGTAKSDTLRPKRLPIHIGLAGERARPPVLNFFVLDQMNRTEPKTGSLSHIQRAGSSRRNLT